MQSNRNMFQQRRKSKASKRKPHFVCTVVALGALKKNKKIKKIIKNKMHIKRIAFISGNKMI